MPVYDTEHVFFVQNDGCDAAGPCEAADTYITQTIYVVVYGSYPASSVYLYSKVEGQQRREIILLTSPNVHQF